MSNFRRLLVAQRRLPYKEVLEYLESTGTQYIDTGLVVKANTLADFTFQFTEIPSTASGIFGTAAGAAASVMAYRSNSIWWFKITTKTEDLDKHHVVFSKDGNCYKDGISIATRGTFGRQQNYTMLLFASLTDNNVIQYSSSKIFNFKFYEGDVLTRDYIPVLDWNDVPCMYDRVNNKLYYNQGTGEFSYKKWNYTSVNYIESSGTQYIDTNLYVDGNITIKATVNPLDTGGFFYWGCGAYQSKSVTYNLWTVKNSGSSVWGSAMFSFLYSYLVANEFNTILQNKDGVYVNNELKVTYQGTTNLASYPMWLFKANENNGTTTYNSGAMQLKDFSILDGNNQTLIDLIPVRDENNTIGLYDSVRNQILYNAGTDDFQGYIETDNETYQIGNYIESNGTQRIELPISGNARWIITAQGASITNSSKVLIASTNSATTGTWYGENVSEGNWGSGTDADSGIPVTTKATADLTFTNNGVSGTVNGISISRSVSATQGTWYILGALGGALISAKVFGAKVYQNNQLVLNLLPATRISDSKVGLYDTVTNSFFVDDNGGTFTMG